MDTNFPLDSSVKEFREKFEVMPEGPYGKPAFTCEGGYCQESPVEIEKFWLSKLTAAREEGRREAVEYIKEECGITPDLSPVNDYVIPFKVLEAAKSPPKGDNE